MYKYFSSLTLIGCIFVLLYVVTTAGSMVLVNRVEILINPLLLAFYSFLITTLLFIFLNVKYYQQWWRMFSQHYVLVALINITSAAMWLSVFYGVNNFNPAIFTGVVFSVLPLTTTLFSFKQAKTTILKRYELVFSGLIAATLLLLSFNDIIHEPLKTKSLANISLAAICGFMAGITNILAHRLGMLKFSATQVLSVRFYLLLLISVSLLLGIEVDLQLPTLRYVDVLFVGLVTVALPLYFMQKGLEYIDPVFVAFLITLVPVITFCIQVFTTEYGFSWSQFLLLLLLSAILFASVLTKWILQYNPKKIKPTVDNSIDRDIDIILGEEKLA